MTAASFIRRFAPLACALVFAGLCAFTAPAAWAAGYSVSGPVPLDAAARWDYAAFEPTSGHVYATLGDHVTVFDPAKGAVITRIGGVEGAHGVVFAPALGLGFISSGRTDSIVTFDLASGKTLRTTPAGGKNPDALLFLPESGKLYSFNGKSQDVSVIDPASGTVEASIKVSGKPEFAAGDADHIYLNLEDIHQLAVIDVHTNKVLRTIDLVGCEEPTGLDYDRVHGRVFSVCANGHLIVTATDDGRLVADVAIGEGPDAVIFDPARKLLISSNGKAGTLSIVHQDDADHYRPQETVSTAVKARTMAYDPASGKVYLPIPTTEGQFGLIEVSPGR